MWINRFFPPGLHQWSILDKEFLKTFFFYFFSIFLAKGSVFAKDGLSEELFERAAAQIIVRKHRQ